MIHVPPSATTDDLLDTREMLSSIEIRGMILANAGGYASRPARLLEVLLDALIEQARAEGFDDGRADGWQAAMEAKHE